MRRWIVDGMNVIGTRADRWWQDRDGAMRRFVDELAAYAKSSGDEVTVVFERAPEGLGDEPEIDVRWASRAGADAADDEIVRLVASAADPARLRVVTSDRRLGERVRELGAQVSAPRSFLRRLERSP